MNIVLTSISARRVRSSGPMADILEFYVARVTRYIPCAVQVFSDEERFLDFTAKIGTRTRPAIFLADSRGQQVTSEDFASVVGALQDSGVQQLVLAIGPASGWSTQAVSVATRLVSFGRITLPHELAVVVAAEQMYRAMTIRAGHPYHHGH